MLRIIRIIKTITSLLFIGALLLTYLYTAAKVNVYVDLKRINLIKMEHLFFITLGIFVLVNLLFLIFDKTLSNYRNKKRKLSPVLMTEKFQAWVNGLNAAINVLMASAITFVGFLNSDKSLKLLDLTIFLYVGPVAVLLTLLALPWVFIPEKNEG